MLITSFFNEQKRQWDRAGENRKDEACGMHIKKQRQWRGKDEERISTTEKLEHVFRAHICHNSKSGQIR